MWRERNGWHPFEWWLPNIFNLNGFNIDCSYLNSTGVSDDRINNNGRFFNLDSDFPRIVRFRCHKRLKSPYGGKKRERTRKEDEERKWVRSWEEDSVADVCTVHVHGIKLKSRSIADACRWMHSKKFHRKQSKIWNITQKLEWMANNGKSLMFLTRHTRTNGYTVASCVGGGRRRATSGWDDKCGKQRLAGEHDQPIEWEEGRSSNFTVAQLWLKYVRHIPHTSSWKVRRCKRFSCKCAIYRTQ